MDNEPRIGLQIRFKGDIREYDKWKQEWAIATKQVRLNAARRGIDLSKMKIVEKVK